MTINIQEAREGQRYCVKYSYHQSNHHPASDFTGVCVDIKPESDCISLLVSPSKTVHLMGRGMEIIPIAESYVESVKKN